MSKPNIQNIPNRWGGQPHFDAETRAVHLRAWEIWKQKQDEEDKARAEREHPVQVRSFDVLW